MSDEPVVEPVVEESPKPPVKEKPPCPVCGRPAYLLGRKLPDGKRVVKCKHCEREYTILPDGTRTMRMVKREIEDSNAPILPAPAGEKDEGLTWAEHLIAKLLKDANGAAKA